MMLPNWQRVCRGSYFTRSASRCHSISVPVCTTIPNSFLHGWLLALLDALDRLLGAQQSREMGDERKMNPGWVGLSPLDLGQAQGSDRSRDGGLPVP